MKSSLLVIAGGGLAATAAIVAALLTTSAANVQEASILAATLKAPMKSPLLVGGGLVAIVAALLARRTANLQGKEISPDEEEVLELLLIDKHLTNHGAIATLTWFSGDYKNAIPGLRDRMEQILLANPWLTGHFKNHWGKFLLVYNIIQEDSIGTFCAKHFHVASEGGSPMSRDMSVDEFGDAASAFLRDKSPQSLFQVAVVPCKEKPSERFALIVSMSHGIADGHTFYAIHGMLCDKHVRPLIVRRIATTEEQQIAAMGNREYYFARSPGFVFNALGGLLYSAFFGVKVHSRYAVVDSDAMQKAKVAAAKDGGVRFCSTNDVLTSYVMQECGTSPPHGLMVINWRNRLAGHTDDHAGNYESGLFLNREDSKTPALIRRAVSTLKRAVSIDSLPSFWNVATGSSIIVSNWSSFAEPNVLPSSDCKEDLHIPLPGSFSNIPSTVAFVFIFRAGPGKLAACLVGTEQQVEFRQEAPLLSYKTRL